MELYPEVQIQIEAEPVRNLLERLTRFELETALLEILPDIQGIELTRWRTDELVLVVAASHPLAGRRDLSTKDLKGYSWCTREANSSIAANLRYRLHESIGPYHVALEATSNWAVRHAVIAGGGIGCLSRALIQSDIDNGQLCELEVADFRYTRALSLARPKDIWRSPLTRAFDQFLLHRGDPAEE